jgi:hypothetical protein
VSVVVASDIHVEEVECCTWTGRRGLGFVIDCVACADDVVDIVAAETLDGLDVLQDKLVDVRVLATFCTTGSDVRICDVGSSMVLVVFVLIVVRQCGGLMKRM